MPSSSLCKEPEGAIFPFRVFIEAVEDLVEDAIHAGHIHKTDHGPGSAANLHEAALDDVGGSQLSPEVRKTGTPAG